MTRKPGDGQGLNRPFKDLAGIVPRTAAAAKPPAAPPAPRRPPPPARTDDDARAFEEAMRGAAPLPAEQRRRRAAAGAAATVHPVAAPPRRPPRAAEAEDDATLADLVTGAGTFAVETAGETIAARAAGIDARLLRRLRAGEYPVEATLDLHGRARAEALEALERFVMAAQAQRRRCILVVHGRGNNSAADGPVLRPAVWSWLTSSRRARAAVMAFASARPEQGGDGATMVLLRRVEKG